MSNSSFHRLTLWCALGCAPGLLVAACRGESATPSEAATASETAVESSEQADSTTEAPAPTLCTKYGGPEGVAGAVEVIVQELAGDCRVSAMFTTLEEPRFDHLVQCLTVQVQELLGCEGIAYAGATSESGRACRDMRTTHTGLGLSQGDFDATVEDIVAGMTKAGVERADIDALAPTILGLGPEIVEKPDDKGLTRSVCP